MQYRDDHTTPNPGSRRRTFPWWPVIGVMILAVRYGPFLLGGLWQPASATIIPYRGPYMFATVSPTPVPADPGELSGLVRRFYHDADLGTKASLNDALSILSESFLRDHGSTLVRNYGFINKPNVTITGVRGFAVDYTVEYDYVADNGAKLHWRRSGVWVAAHGSSGWQLNEDKWTSIHITSISNPAGATLSVRDRVYSDGRHVFDIPGIQITFKPTDDGWATSFALLATPRPVPRAAAPRTNCEQVFADGAYDDGAIFGLHDGRHFCVADYDTMYAAA